MRKIAEESSQLTDGTPSTARRGLSSLLCPQWIYLQNKHLLPLSSLLCNIHSNSRLAQRLDRFDATNNHIPDQAAVTHVPSIIELPSNTPAVIAAIHIPVEATVPPCRVPSSGSHCVAGSTWTTVHLSCGCVNSYYLISYYTKLNHSYHIMLYYTTMSYLSGRLVWSVPQERDQEMAQKLLLRLRDCSYQIYFETN